MKAVQQKIKMQQTSHDCVICMCDEMLATRGCYAVLVIPSEKHTQTKNNSSYKIQFYCQNSAHKTLENDCKKHWLIVNSSNWIFKPHQSTNFEGMFPQNQRYKWTLFY